MGVVFISLLGTQVGAVINPLMAVTEQCGAAPETIYLLGTRTALAKFRPAVEYLETKESYGKITPLMISDSLTTDAEGFPPAHLLMGDILTSIHGPDNRIVFNLGGGMNFQIAACLQLLFPFHPLFLYPDNEGIYSFTLDSGRIDQLHISPFPKPVDILSLQGVPFTVVKGKPSEKLMGWINARRKARRFSFQTNLKIRNVVFQLAWNQNNTMHFLTEAGTSEHAASVIGLADVRDAFGDLYHRKIYVLTDNEAALERMRKEGRKISPHFFKADNPISMDIAFKAIFGDPAFPSPTDNTDIRTNSGAECGDAALLVMLGTNIMPTLASLWSHRPKKAVVFYTNGNPDIETYKNTMLDHHERIPAQQIQFIPVSFLGREILNFRPPAGPSVINVTPGTKSHTAFLSSWAQQYNGDLYSIETITGRVTRIPDGEGIKPEGPDIETLLTFQGYDFVIKGYNSRLHGNLTEEYRRLADFIRAIQTDPDKTALFPETPFVCPAGECRCENGKTLLVLNNGKAKIFIKSGEWLEKVTAFMMMECGADEAVSRIQTTWSEKTQAMLKNRYKNAEIFMRDMDVIARFGANYYVIECKTQKNATLETLAHKVIGDAAVVEHWAVPLVCVFRQKGEPQKKNIGSGVYFFGHETLFDKTKMQNLLKTALAERQTRGRT